MKKILLITSMALSLSILATSFYGFSNEAKAEDITGSWQELEYGHQAVMDRRDERIREMQLQQYQQRQFMQQQQLMNQKNLYNQVHQSREGLKLEAKLGGGWE